MREVPIRHGPLTFEGATELRWSSAGVTPLRLPSRVLASLPPGFLAVASCASGVRLTLVTNSQELAVEVEQVHLAPSDGTPVRPIYDLLVDHELRESVVEPSGSVYDRTTDSIIEHGTSAMLRFRALGGGEKRVELWLPTMSWVTVRRVLVDDGADVEPAQDVRPRWIVHGSSITHGARADSPSQTWPAHAARLADLSLINLGMASNCLGEQWVARSIRDVSADLITLKLAVNVWNFASMNERAFVAAIHGFLDTVRDGHPKTPITIVSPIHTPGGETQPGPSVVAPDGRHVGTGTAGGLSIGAMRAALADIVELRLALGDKQLRYVDGRDLLGVEDEAWLYDGLHPEGAGHLAMGERYCTLQNLDRAEIR
jgi:hypothetical protein